MLKIEIDGKILDLTVLNSVKVIVDLTDEDGPAELHVTITPEGIIKDLIENGEVTATKTTDFFDETAFLEYKDH